MLIALSVAMAFLFPFCQSALASIASMFHKKLIGGNNPYFLERLQEQLESLNEKWFSRHYGQDLKNKYAEHVSKTLAMRNGTLVGKAVRGLLGCKVTGEDPQEIIDDFEMRATTKLPKVIFKVKIFFTLCDLILLSSVGGLLYWDDLQTGWVIGPLVLGVLIGGYQWLGRKSIMSIMKSNSKDLPLFVDNLREMIDKTHVSTDALKRVLQTDPSTDRS
jgi:hypothetical protein